MIHFVGVELKGESCAAEMIVRRTVQLCRSREAGSVGSPSAVDPGDCERGAGGAGAGLRGALRAGWPAFDPAKKLLRAMLLQAFYSIRSERQLMSGWTMTSCSAGSSASASRCGVGSFDLLEEPRPSACGRHRSEVPGVGSVPAAGEAAVVERALLGRWHPDRGVGVD